MSYDPVEFGQDPDEGDATGVAQTSEAIMKAAGIPVPDHIAQIASPRLTPVQRVNVSGGPRPAAQAVNVEQQMEIEVEHRLELAAWYRAARDTDLFDDMSSPYAQAVQREVASFLKMRMRALTGVQTEAEQAQQFNTAEVRALKALASKLTEVEDRTPPEEETPLVTAPPPPPPPPARKVAAAPVPATKPQPRRATAPEPTSTPAPVTQPAPRPAPQRPPPSPVPPRTPAKLPEAKRGARKGPRGGKAPRKAEPAREEGGPGGTSPLDPNDPPPGYQPFPDRRGMEQAMAVLTATALSRPQMVDTGTTVVSVTGR